MQEQNALIGVAVAGLFPDISLSGMLQWIGTNPLPFNVANAVWSLGAAGTRDHIRRRVCARRKSMPRARSIGRASPIIGRPCSPRFSRSRINSPPSAFSTQQLVEQQAAVKDAREAVDVYLESIPGGHDRFHHRGDGAIHAAWPTRKPN